MLHSDFARLLPSQRRVALEGAAERFPFPARLVTFSSGASKAHTYVTLLLNEDTEREEYATFLACPQNVSRQRLARTGRHDGEVYLDAGHYGFDKCDDAARDMFRRANR